MYISSVLYKVLVAFITSSAAVSADKMLYKVVSYVPSNHSAGVMIDGQLYPLKVQDESSLYFTGKAPVAQTGYNYVIIDSTNSIVQQENFTRAPVTKGDTYNEYYNRSWNSLSLAQLPTILDPLPIVNRIKSDLHIDGQIPTIHIIGNQSSIDYIHDHPQEDVEFPMYMTYISPSDVKTFKNMSFAISGHSTRNTAKLSYKIKIDKHDGTLYEYRRFKLRAMAMDSSYMKDELCYDIANKIGLPTSKNSYVRLFINDQPIGLFGLAEVFKNPWIRNEFANGDKSYNQGAFFVTDVNQGKGAAIPSGNFSFPQNMTHGNMSQFSISSLPLILGVGSDLSYLGDNVTRYEAPYSLKEDPSVGEANYTRIMELTKFISQQPNTTMVDDSYAEAWEKVLDVESAIREIAFEIVTSDMDSYMMLGNNYILYDDLENERIVMSGQDFDLTMGTIVSDQLIGGNYSEYFGFGQRPLTTTLFKVPKYKQRLEELIKNFTSSLVNPNVMYPRIDSLSSLITQDVEWDQSLPRVSKTTFSIAPQAPFSVAVNGSYSNYSAEHNNTLSPFGAQLNITSLFLKEWVQIRSANLLNFFNVTSDSNSTTPNTTLLSN